MYNFAYLTDKGSARHLIGRGLHRSHEQRMRLSAENAQADVWQACCEEQGRQGAAREVLRPLTDALIRRCLSMGPWEFNGKPLWHRVLDFALDAGACPKPCSSATAGEV